VTLRMISAELLKLRKRRMIVIATIVMTLGIVLLVLVIPEIYHLAHSGSDPSGGTRGMQRGAVSLAFIGSVAGLIVGSAAGTGDVATGIFRDLVATGRSRWALFAARIPGAVLLFFPIVTVAYWVMAGLDVWFSSSTFRESGGVFVCQGGGGPCPQPQILSFAAPGFSAFGHWYLWVLLVTLFDLLVALGLASLAGSRSLTIGVLLGFQLIVSPLLSAVSQLGGLRQILFPQSFTALSPLSNEGGQDSGIHIFGTQITTSVGMAWLVVALWVVGLIAAGAYRTSRRDA
jgi:hypothetical protein